MADHTVLRNNAIVKNAQVAPSPPHGVVQSGALNLVQVKSIPGGPLVKEQPKSVQIVPTKEAKGAVATGGLPMVHIKNTLNGPQPDDGNDRAVVIRDTKHGPVSAGGLPMLDVKMTDAGPQIQTMPTVQEAPPHIPGAQPVLSAPRVTHQAAPVNQGYVVSRGAGPFVGPSRVARVAAPTGHAGVVRVAAPQLQAPVASVEVPLPPIPEFTTDQLMLCRHLVDKYIVDLNAVTAETAEASAEAPAKSEVAKLAEVTLAAIEDALIATAVRAEAVRLAAEAAAAAPVQTVQAAPSITPTPTVRTAAVSIAPTPSVAYNAGRVGGGAGRPQLAAGGRTQRNSTMAPRRTPRGPLPPVIVKMEGQKAVVQNQAEVAEARAALEAEGAIDGAPVAPAPKARGPLPPVIVRMEGQKAVVQNQAEIAKAKAALEAQAAADAAAAQAAIDAAAIDAAANTVEAQLVAESITEPDPTQG